MMPVSHAGEGESAGMTMGRNRRNKYKEIMDCHKANGKLCAYCERAMNADSIHLMPTRDHTTPRSLGGRHTTWVCWDCNGIKSDMTWESWRVFMAAHPGWWHGVPARIRNRYRPGWVPYEQGDNAAHNDRNLENEHGT